MATKKKTKSASGAVDTATVDPGAMYHVIMRYPHKIGRIQLSPVYKSMVKGWVLKDIPVYKIASFEAV